MSRTKGESKLALTEGFENVIFTFPEGWLASWLLAIYCKYQVLFISQPTDYLKMVGNTVNELC